MSQATAIDRMLSRDREIDKLMESLSAEKAKIRTAIEVIQEYSDDMIEPEDSTGGRVPRPPGIPTLYEMVVNVLTPHDLSGGLTSTGIIDLIRATYWPGVRSDQIAPSIYRFLKDKRLAKKGDKFRLAKRIEAPQGGQPSQAPQSVFE